MQIKIKVGDYVVCKTGFSELGYQADGIYGGAGYVIGKMFKIRKIETPYNNTAILWPVGGDAGIFLYAVRKLTQEELPLEDILDQIKQEVNS